MKHERFILLIRGLFALAVATLFLVCSRLNDKFVFDLPASLVSNRLIAINFHVHFETFRDNGSVVV